jgi:hypothetical protein
MPPRVPQKADRCKPARPGIIKPPTCASKDAETLFTKVAEDVLTGSREMFDSLSATERETVIQWMAEAIITGNAENAVHNILWEMDYVRKPVDIETFLFDDYYGGRIFRDANGNFALYPRWLEDLKTVFGPTSRVVEWIMTGSIGIGKTAVSMVALLFKLYRLSCLRNPAAFYSLMPGSLIVFGIFSKTKRLVADTGYFKLRSMVDVSPYFREKFPRNTKIDSKMDFSPTTKKNIQVINGSQGFHGLGQDVLCFAMDEVNFMSEKRDVDAATTTGQAYEIYNTISTRLRSRFMREGGSIPGITILMSSRNSQTSFLEERIKKSKDDPSTYISDYALWDVHPKHRYKPTRFMVEVGDRISQSRILKPGEEPRDNVKVVAVPDDFRRNFEEDTDQALRDIAGVATFNVSPFIRDRMSVFDAVRTTMVHPFRREQVSLDIEDDVMLTDYLRIEDLCRKVESHLVPRLNPGAVRFGHVDLAITGDSAGLAMGHISGMVRHRKTNVEGQEIQATDPFIIMDLFLRITPPPGSEIDFSKIRAFWVYLRRCGFNLKTVTFDEYQSRDSQQILFKSGFQTNTVSMDRSVHQYKALRSTFFDRRIAMYHYDPVIDELLDLQFDTKAQKVDHPVRASKKENGLNGKGSKDVADAMAGVVWNAISDINVHHDIPVFDLEDYRPQVAVIDPTVEAVAKAKEQKTRFKKVGGVVVDMEAIRGEANAR